MGGGRRGRHRKAPCTCTDIRKATPNRSNPNPKSETPNKKTLNPRPPTTWSNLFATVESQSKPRLLVALPLQGPKNQQPPTKPTNPQARPRPRPRHEDGEGEGPGQQHDNIRNKSKKQAAQDTQDSGHSSIQGRGRTGQPGQQRRALLCTNKPHSNPSSPKQCPSKPC